MTSESIGRKIILRPEQGETVAEIKDHPGFEKLKQGLRRDRISLVVEEAKAR